MLLDAPSKSIIMIIAFERKEREHGRFRLDEVVQKKDVGAEIGSRESASDISINPGILLSLY